MQVPELEYLSQYTFELSQEANNRQASFKIGKAIKQYLQSCTYNDSSHPNYNGHLSYPLFSIIIDETPYYIIKELPGSSYRFDNNFGITRVPYQSENYIEVMINETTGDCTIKAYADHTIKFIGMETVTEFTAPTTNKIIPERSLVFE